MKLFERTEGEGVMKGRLFSERHKVYVRKWTKNRIWSWPTVNQGEPGCLGKDGICEEEGSQLIFRRRLELSCHLQANSGQFTATWIRNW